MRIHKPKDTGWKSPNIHRFRLAQIYSEILSWRVESQEIHTLTSVEEELSSTRNLEPATATRAQDDLQINPKQSRKKTEPIADDLGRDTAIGSESVNPSINPVLPDHDKRLEQGNKGGSL